MASRGSRWSWWTAPRSPIESITGRSAPQRAADREAAGRSGRSRARTGDSAPRSEVGRAALEKLLEGEGKLSSSSDPYGRYAGTSTYDEELHGLGSEMPSALRPSR